MLMTSRFRLASLAVLLSLLAGCATQHHRAPVEDRGRSGGASGSGNVSAPKPPPGAENAGKPGYYTVAKGDTLIRIALESGQNYRDIANWNNLENPNLIEVGQVLRVVPPSVDAASTLPAAKPISVPKVEAKGLDGKGSTAAAPVASAATKPAGAAGVVASAASSTAQTPAPVASSASESSKDTADEPAWIWPSNGPVVGGFEEGKRKGLAIGGKEGDPVLAAGDGRVVYAGSGLRGYGNLIIIKHGGEYLTAYAHNKVLLVKEDQVVRKGQKIAEMGSTDADRVQLHFEIRKQGKPIDPSKQLPAR
ncbi:peptidoglycan DD-metalloendopeptidase family protein [Aquabacterium sp.]|uniref:peptidoglycan DD-metalloendopeptidase family protein n=1 Tax=Aquabacterium sp. TaxID=1872578 RepID=UPI002E34A510|nr:peptidoglycan DD-metalloendopeptidase family protein [Aquabacterium sp.]HEX5310666.1 peptidoglycan DD-metalloendopeptidase family protein [Aquabacterium sp.]